MSVKKADLLDAREAEWNKKQDLLKSVGIDEAIQQRKEELKWLEDSINKATSYGGPFQTEEDLQSYMSQKQPTDAV